MVVVVSWVSLTPAEEFSGKVVGVSDGDTITVLQNRTPIKVRLHGIDCPEIGQDFGSRAKAFTSELVFGQVVKVVPRDTDRYGRTVADVILADGRILNHELVRAGLTGQRCPGEPAPRPGEWEAGHACKSLPKPSVRSGRPGSEGSNMSKSPSGRKRVTRASSPTGKSETPPAPAARETEPLSGRGGWRSGVPPPQGRGPASLLRGDRVPRLLPLAGAGPARRHRLGRLARSRAATRGLGLRGLAARVFGPPGEPPSEALASECGHFVGSRLELHDGDEPNCPLRVEDRVDAFNNLEDL